MLWRKSPPIGLRRAPYAATSQLLLAGVLAFPLVILARFIAVGLPPRPDDRPPLVRRTIAAEPNEDEPPEANLAAA